MKIGYLNIIKEEDSYVGGIMISDERGIPIEFKYTEPIVPTKLQKVLYGEVLEKYLREEIIVSNLASKIENAPEFYIIDEPRNFCLRNSVKEKVVMIKNTQLKPVKDVENNYKFIKDTEAIIQMGEESAPLRLIISEDMVPEKDEIAKKIVEAAKDMGITEPLIRIEEALKLVCRKEL